LKFKSEGKHLIPQGKELIIKIISQMNNSRLSTFSINTNTDRANLEKEIALFEGMPPFGQSERPLRPSVRPSEGGGGGGGDFYEYKN
jgi:hypothetical protein